MEKVRKFRYSHLINRLMQVLSHEDDYDIELTVTCNQYKVRHIISECTGNCNDCQYYKSDYKFNDKNVLEKNIQEKIMYEIPVLMDRMKDDLPIEKDLYEITKDIDSKIDKIVEKINIIYKNDDIEILSAVSIDEIDDRINKIKFDCKVLESLYSTYRKFYSEKYQTLFEQQKYKLENYIDETLVFIDKEYGKILNLNNNLGIKDECDDNN